MVKFCFKIGGFLMLFIDFFLNKPAQILGNYLIRGLEIA